MIRLQSFKIRSMFTHIQEMLSRVANSESCVLATNFSRWTYSSSANSVLAVALAVEEELNVF